MLRTDKHNQILSNFVLKHLFLQLKDFSEAEIEESAHLLIEKMKEKTGLGLRYILFSLTIDQSKFEKGTLKRLILEKAIEICKMAIMEI